MVVIIGMNLIWHEANMWPEPDIRPNAHIWHGYSNVYDMVVLTGLNLIWPKTDMWPKLDAHIRYAYSDLA
jgi:hypothetical protein